MTSASISACSELEEKVLSSVKHANCVLELFEMLAGGKRSASIAALHALRRVFAAFHERGDVGVKAAADASGSLAIYRAWLREQHGRFAAELAARLRAPTATASIQVAAARTLLGLVRRGGSLLRASAATPCEFGVEMFGELVAALVACEAPTPRLLAVVRDEILGADACVDARYHFLRSVPKALGGDDDAAASDGAETASLAVGAEARARATQNIIVLLRLVDMPKDATALTRLLVPIVKAAEAPTRIGAKRKRARKGPKVLRLDMHRKAFGACWMTVLRQPLALGSDAMESILTALPTRVIPHLDSPVLLRDRLADVVIASSALKAEPGWRLRSEAEREAAARCDLLALQSLWVLLRDHQLDYPKFYFHMFARLNGELLLATETQRHAFVNLLHHFLRSTALPAYYAAAFSKRMARLALVAPPADAMVLLILVSHLLSRHPKARAALLGKPGGAASGNTPAAAGPDPFNAAEDDPAQCGAMESTLWEIATLQTHHYAPLAAVAVAFRTELPGTMAIQSGGPDAPPTYAPDNALISKLCAVDNRMLLAQEIKRATRATHVPTTYARPASILSTASAAPAAAAAAAEVAGQASSALEAVARGADLKSRSAPGDLRSIFRWA